MEDLKITEMFSSDGEKVPFSEELYPTGNVEDWLLEVERIMRASLNDILRRALEEYPEVRDWADTHAHHSTSMHLQTVCETCCLRCKVLAYIPRIILSSRFKREPNLLDSYHTSWRIKYSFILTTARKCSMFWPGERAIVHNKG